MASCERGLGGQSSHMYFLPWVGMSNRHMMGHCEERAPPAAFGGNVRAFRTMSLTLSAVPRTSMPEEKYTKLGFQARSFVCSSDTAGDRSTATCTWYVRLCSVCSGRRQSARDHVGRRKARTLPIKQAGKGPGGGGGFLG